VLGVRKLLIDLGRGKDLRIRNAWVRGSNPLCGTNLKIGPTTFLGTEDSTRPIRTPDRQQDGSTNRRSRFDRPQGDPEGVRRVAPNNPLCGTICLIYKVFLAIFGRRFLREIARSFSKARVGWSNPFRRTNNR
jgi:hypothetical protein